MLLLIAIGTTKANTTLLGLMAFVKDDGIVIISVILILVKVSVGWKKTAGVMANFLIAYLVCFLCFVLLRNNLVNYLAGASYRFVFQLLPLAMILLFTCVLTV